MKNHYLLIIVLVICFSCKNKPEENTLETKIMDTILPTKEDIKQTIEETETKVDTEIRTNNIIEKNVRVISVNEELIMPSDYLTTAMTVKTSEDETFVFLDMDGYEKLVGKDITIKYELEEGEKLLVCFDCLSYSEDINLFDITATHTQVEYKKLQLTNYEEDEFITVNSIYTMKDSDGKTESYGSTNDELIKDSLKMKSDFYTYGIVTKVHPELLNKDELLKMVE